jgi:hypothetical protein
MRSRWTALGSFGVCAGWIDAVSQHDARDRLVCWWDGKTVVLMPMIDGEELAQGAFAMVDQDGRRWRACRKGES